MVDLIEGTDGKVVFGGERDEASRYVSPTLVTDLNGTDKLMKVWSCVGGGAEPSEISLSTTVRGGGGT